MTCVAPTAWALVLHLSSGGLAADHVEGCLRDEVACETARFGAAQVIRRAGINATVECRYGPAREERR